MGRKRIGLFMGEISQFFQKACGMRIIELAHERNIYSQKSATCPARLTARIHRTDKKTGGNTEELP